MRIAVMGAGSVGGYLGGMLSRGGNDVSLIARGAHLRAIVDHGLRVIRDQEQFTVRSDATDDPSRVGEVELVLLTVKTYQNDQAVPAMLPLVGPDTSVLCLQNGIDSYQAAAAKVGLGRVLPGAAYIEVGVPVPGVVKQTGTEVRIAFGEADGSESDRGTRILATLEQSGIPAQFDRNIQKTLWTKFLLIASMAGVTSLSRETMAQLMPRPEWRQVVVGCLREVETVGRAAGVDLDSKAVEGALSYFDTELEQLHSSMHADITAGRPLELETLNGAVIRVGREVNVPTPINDVIYAMLKPFQNGDFDKHQTAD